MSRKSHQPAVSFTSCPQCGHLAEILWGMERPEVDLVKIQCLQGHWFLMPAAGLAADAAWVPARAEAA